ncbi:hypothetical protein IW261DRAFT_204494 [Armillaria novae-zelandiae]|uniref:Secreted protein n=1 Tax=Armillaria novae-zelandiae TaxID=153914 RepID=A0AA39TRM9_9AGAR|nr:hypothetical protein IW261DRAFT_204494 [Armillaria novae-zelandiae]
MRRSCILYFLHSTFVRPALLVSFVHSSYSYSLITISSVPLQNPVDFSKFRSTNRIALVIAPLCNRSRAPSKYLLQ